MYRRKPLEMPLYAEFVESRLTDVYMRGVMVGSVDWESDTAGVIINLRIQCVRNGERTVITLLWPEVPFTRYEDGDDWCIDFDEDSGLEDFIYSHKEIMPTFGNSWGRLMAELTDSEAERITLKEMLRMPSDEQLVKSRLQYGKMLSMKYEFIDWKSGGKGVIRNMQIECQSSNSKGTIAVIWAEIPFETVIDEDEYVHYDAKTRFDFFVRTHAVTDECEKSWNALEEVLIQYY